MAVTNLLSKYTILYGKVMTLVVTIQSVARRWTTIDVTHVYKYTTIMFSLVPRPLHHSAKKNGLVHKVQILGSVPQIVEQGSKIG